MNADSAPASWDEDDPWAGHPDIVLSDAEVRALIAEDYRSGTWTRP